MSIEQKPAKKPNRLVQFLWSLLILWAIILVGTGFSLADRSITALVGYLISAVGCAVPAAWGLMCQRSDTVALKQWEEDNAKTAEASKYLTEEDKTFLGGLNPLPIPTRKPRYWKIVAPVSIIVAFSGIAIAGNGVQNL